MGNQLALEQEVGRRARRARKGAGHLIKYPSGDTEMILRNVDTKPSNTETCPQ